MSKEVRPFGIRDKIGYAMGDLGCGLSFSLVTNTAMLFYMQCMGLREVDWAWIIIVSKVWDAINDILIGNLIDHKKISKSASKFMPWISIGSIGLVVFTIMVFVPVKGFNYTGKVIWCLLSYCLWSVAYTMVNVPYGSLHSVISENTKDRTTLSTFRSVGAGVATVLTMLLPKIIYNSDNQLSENAVFAVSIVFSVAAFFILFGMRKLVTERVVREEHHTEEKIDYLAAVKTYFSNRAMIAATIASAASIIFFISSVSVSNLVFQFYFGDAKKAALANIASYVPMVIIMPLIGKIVAKIGKKSFICSTALISTVAGIVLALIPISRSTSGMAIWVVGLMFVNVGNCVFQVSVWAIIAGCIERSYRQTGRREESSLYAIYSFFRKLSQGIGSALVALALGAVGYVESAKTQTAQVSSNIKTLYIVLLTVGSAIVFLSMKFIYNIGKKEENEFDAQAEKDAAEA